MTKKDDRPEIKEEADAEKAFQAGKHPDHDLPGSGPGSTPGAHPDHDLPEPKPPVVQPKGKGVGGRAITKDASTPKTALSALLPPSAAIGDPTFAIRVIGTGFDASSVINFASQDEPTTFVSETELTTIVDMTLWLGADPAIPVLVRTLVEGVPEETDTLLFVFDPPREVPLHPAHPSLPVPSMDLITPM
jgi:hypothetical protein